MTLPDTPSHPDLAEVRLDLITRCVEAASHRINNLIGISHGQLALHLVDHSAHAREDLHELSERYRLMAQLQEALVKQVRMIALKPGDELITLASRYDAHLTVLELIAAFTHTTIQSSVSFEALHASLHASWLAHVEMIALHALAHGHKEESLHIEIDKLDGSRAVTFCLSASSTRGGVFKHRARRALYAALHAQGDDMAHLDSSGDILTITLPDCSKQGSPRGEEERLRSTHIDPAHTTKCLLIDDEFAMLGPMQRILKYEGFDVTAFTSPLEALTHDAASFDIALIDYSMNELDGLRTLERLRGGHDALPAIIITGMPDAALLESLRHDSLTAILTKPWSTPQLLMTMRRLLDKA